MTELLRLAEGEEMLDQQSRHLVVEVRSAIAIHHELLTRILSEAPLPSLILASILEDAGNRYLDFSDVIAAAALPTAAVRD